MKLKIYKNDKNEEPIDAVICHDINGNIYLKLVMTKDDISENIYYFLTIDEKDNIEWIKIENYASLQSTTAKATYNDIKNTYEKNSLKGKILKELEDNEIDNMYTSDPEDEAEYKIKYKSYPEDRYYTVDKDYTDDDKCKYTFSKSGDETAIELLDKTLSCLSSYDTFVIDEMSSFVLMTLESDEKCSYRITIFTSGNIALNIVGSKIKLFNTTYSMDDGNICLSSNIIKTNIVVYN